MITATHGRRRQIRQWCSIVLVVATVASAAGCSMLDSELPGRSSSPPSPAWRILNPSLTRRQTAGGILTVSRQANRSWTCLHRVFLDEEAVADLRSNEFVTIYLPAGPHVLSVRGTFTSCPGFSTVNIDVVRGLSLGFISEDATDSNFELRPDGNAR